MAPVRQVYPPSCVFPSTMDGKPERAPDSGSLHFGVISNLGLATAAVALRRAEVVCGMM